jgi:CheY-like chemotaxis protein
MSERERPRILIVDDEELILEALKRQLHQGRHYL